MKFIDYNSPEKKIIKEKFNSIPYMDVNISNIVEAYIYENIIKVYEKGSREEYIERYRKKEGEYKKWHPNGQLEAQRYYKEGKLEGEYIWWNDNGQLWFQKYYKEGKLDGEYKEWNNQGELISHKIYTGGEVFEDLLKA
jgi:antitoxin component YwqK of YwqJK toxin-antitoxin module